MTMDKRHSVTSFLGIIIFLQMITSHLCLLSVLLNKLSQTLFRTLIIFNVLLDGS